MGPLAGLAAYSTRSATRFSRLIFLFSRPGRPRYEKNQWRTDAVTRHVTSICTVFAWNVTCHIIKSPAALPHGRRSESSCRPPYTQEPKKYARHVVAIAVACILPTGTFSSWLAIQCPNEGKVYNLLESQGIQFGSSLLHPRALFFFWSPATLAFMTRDPYSLVGMFWADGVGVPVASSKRGSLGQKAGVSSNLTPRGDSKEGGAGGSHDIAYPARGRVAIGRVTGVEAVHHGEVSVDRLRAASQRAQLRSEK